MIIVFEIVEIVTCISKYLCEHILFNFKFGLEVLFYVIFSKLCYLRLLSFEFFIIPEIYFFKAKVQYL